MKKNTKMASVNNAFGWIRLCFFAPMYLYCCIKDAPRLSGFDRMQAIGFLSGVLIFTFPIFWVWNKIFSLSFFQFIVCIAVFVLMALCAQAVANYQVCEDGVGLKSRGIWFPNFMTKRKSALIFWMAIFLVLHMACVVAIGKYWATELAYSM